ncbi:TIGR04279 domain-containing protein [Methanosarcina hadiensis]|uniref:TIGR04279 domain-containing protein n=1 Tax=Methanosarcina hadiensis TaxID=3078083 RepID=UPI0039777AD8
MGVLILTSSPAMAGGGKTDAQQIANLNFTDKVVYFLDHTGDPAEGNWITMGCPNEGTRIKLPKPIKLTYNGPKHEEYGGVSGTLNKEETESYTITYPSTSSYTTHPIFISGENVTLSFHGESGLKGSVDVYLFKITSERAYRLFDSFQAGDIGNINTLFEDSVEGEYEKYSVILDNCSDITDYDLGKLDAGQYCVVMVQQNQDKSLTVFSSTAFVVAEYKMCVTSPSCIVKGNDMDITMSLEGASGNNYTYGAVLIKEQAYKANIEINSNGTKAGTSVIVNEVDLIEEFDINSSNYKSKLTRNNLQTEIQTLIGEGKGTIAIGESGQNKLSLTTFDLPVGCYYLLVGAYSPEKGLVGLSQKEIEIKSKGSSNGGGGSGGKGGSGGGAGGSPEPAKNVKAKELCQQFVSNGNRIKFEFTKGATPIVYIQFDAKKTAGKITTIVEELKGRSSLTPVDPEGAVYKYLNIWVGNGGFANSNNIENAVAGFKISKDWINENNINMDTIVLQHFDGTQWESLKAEKVGEDDKYIYFEAEPPGFSPFAITASKNVIEIGEKTGNEGQSTPGTEQQDNSELVVDSDEPSKEKGSTLTRIASFFVGFLIIILIGAFIKERIDRNSEDTNSENEQEQEK